MLYLGNSWVDSDAHLVIFTAGLLSISFDLYNDMYCKTENCLKIPSEFISNV